MFIYNVKINGGKIFKTFLSITICLIIFLIIYISFILISKSNYEVEISQKYNQEGYIPTISTSNYTNILKSVHENIDDYVGSTFKFTGYVYRVFDLSSSQFILARDMVISSESDYVVVGFLCDYNNAQNLSNNCWVTITGEITKGSYHRRYAYCKNIVS